MFISTRAIDRNIRHVDIELELIRQDREKHQETLENNRAQVRTLNNEINRCTQNIVLNLDYVRVDQNEEMINQLLRVLPEEQIQAIKARHLLIKAQNSLREQILAETGVVLSLLSELNNKEEDLNQEYRFLSHKRAVILNRRCHNSTFIITLILAIGLIVGGALGLHQIGTISYGGSIACLSVGSPLALIALISRRACFHINR